jgi:hypothetical protein
MELVAGLVEYLDWCVEDGQRCLEIDPENLAGLGKWGHPPEAGVEAATPGSEATSSSKVESPPPREPREIRFALAERMPGCGDQRPAEQTRLVVVSEAAAFESEPGELLDNILKAVGYAFVDGPQQMEGESQLVDLAPRVILSMGNSALKTFVHRGDISMMRGRWKTFHGIDVLCTFDPVYILSQDARKRAVWSDMQDLIKRLDLHLPDGVKQ